jgi:hypothetical protein
MRALFIDDVKEDREGWPEDLGPDWEVKAFASHEEWEESLDGPVKESLAAYDVAILDLDLGANHKDGGRVAAALRREDPTLSILLLTGFRSNERPQNGSAATQSAFDLLREGAIDDYYCKGFAGVGHAIDQGDYLRLRCWILAQKTRTQRRAASTGDALLQRLYSDLADRKEVDRGTLVLAVEQSIRGGKVVQSIQTWITAPGTTLKVAKLLPDPSLEIEWTRCLLLGALASTGPAYTYADLGRKFDVTKHGHGDLDDQLIEALERGFGIHMTRGAREHKLKALVHLLRGKPSPQTAKGQAKVSGELDPVWVQIARQVLQEPR